MPTEFAVFIGGPYDGLREELENQTEYDLAMIWQGKFAWYAKTGRTGQAMREDGTMLPAYEYEFVHYCTDDDLTLVKEAM